ncbi:FkbM family methyltransferase [Halorubrum ezzemoulense]|uniref:FkbM family methyltransferase n=1 Tax=Halorubrum ezzemoulense TaxID=337243 RepID=UPI00232CDFC8|nr:FkbM family methyltransferase [Halorubrum ezzemoulense]MDB9252933.1 hypothetical protein [Halorubrum ezzemoulense]MDB9256683.1 hypothetical protein [Halorubrum ezzemoulense]MDB9278250.1 hypothetical protein [Halorubrum ezzemoulense]
MYQNALKGAISVRKPLNIVQVGANDGKFNDPIYEFVKSHKNATNIILIEPIEFIIPYLKNNYEYHPSTEILNKAVGEEDGRPSISLYRLKKEYWNIINSKTRSGYPNYRIPTGATTSDKDRLIQWVSKNLESNIEPEEVIEGFEIETIQPREIIDQSDILDEVNLLQVDTEGMDDRIVFSFLEENIRPNIINIESTHISKDRQEEYDMKLSKFGYDVYDYTSSEKLALRYKV